MRIRLDPTTLAALVLLLAGVAVASGWLAARLPADAPARHASKVLGAGPRADVERCMEQVATVHDVYWAAACMQAAQAAGVQDDLPDCTLPPERAGPLNAARAADDQRCLSQTSE